MLMKLMNVTTTEDAYRICELFDDPVLAAERYEEYQLDIPEGMNARSEDEE